LKIYIKRAGFWFEFIFAIPQFLFVFIELISRETGGLSYYPVSLCINIDTAVTLSGVF
jgi:hypothetical protein